MLCLNVDQFRVLVRHCKGRLGQILTPVVTKVCRSAACLASSYTLLYQPILSSTPSPGNAPFCSSLTPGSTMSARPLLPKDNMGAGTGTIGLRYEDTRPS